MRNAAHGEQRIHLIVMVTPTGVDQGVRHIDTHIAGYQ